MKATYRINTESKANENNTFCFDKIRITLLTPCLMRLEWSEMNIFTDLPSQKVWFRGFHDVPHTCKRENKTDYIQTEMLTIEVQKNKTLRDSVKIILKERADSNIPSFLMPDSWRYGDEIKTLKGTARTLDNADGEIELEDGIISKSGFSVLEDSKSYLISKTGEMVQREDSDAVDIYLFAYGTNYKKYLQDCLKD